MTESGAAARPPPIRGVPLAILAIGLALSVAVLQFARDLDLARVESVLELRAE